MGIGSIDLSPFDYMIVYKQDGKLYTWTLPEGLFQMNYKQMKKDKSVEIISVYKMLSADEIINKICE
jgi:hypothetical protein